jgi:hypothetical protein
MPGSDGPVTERGSASACRDRTAIHGWPRISAAIAVIVLTTACASVGPKTIPPDHFNYTEAIRESWKEQMLLNLVGLRYAEAPLFLRVTSVINQYSIDGRVSAATPPYEGAGPTAPPLSVSGGYSDRPTITYTPMTGADFTRSVMTPIPPERIMAMIQAGWRADLLFRLAVRSVNGVGETSTLGRSVDPTAYYEIVLLMEKLQESGSLSFRVERRSPTEAAVIVIRGPETEEIRLWRTRLGELLGLEPGRSEYRLVFGHQAADGSEIAMLTRSILEMLAELALWIDVPPEHVASGRTRPSTDPSVMEDLGLKPMIRVASSVDQPDDAFVMVRYQGVWYWIDHDDFPSKRTLGLMQLMFSLAESGRAQEAPVITVGAGGG